MKILEFAFVATDLSRSRAFYEDILGLKSSLFVNEDGQFYIEYEIGPHTLGSATSPS